MQSVARFHIKWSPNLGIFKWTAPLHMTCNEKRVPSISLAVKCNAFWVICNPKNTRYLSGVDSEGKTDLNAPAPELVSDFDLSVNLIRSTCAFTLKCKNWWMMANLRIKFVTINLNSGLWFWQLSCHSSLSSAWPPFCVLWGMWAICGHSAYLDTCILSEIFYGRVCD